MESEVRCPRCIGSGEQPNGDTCPRCGGWGEITICEADGPGQTESHDRKVCSHYV